MRCIRVVNIYIVYTVSTGLMRANDKHRATALNRLLILDYNINVCDVFMRIILYIYMCVLELCHF